MKLLAFGDVHGDWTTGGRERFDETSRALDQVQSYAETRKIDHVVFLGDLTDPDVDATLAHRAIARLLELAVNLHDAEIETDWIVGNHDVIDDGRGSHTLMALERVGFRVWSTPRNRITHPDGKLVEFVFLPYAGLGRRYDPEHYIRELIASSRLGMKGGTLIVAGHLTNVPGALVGSETIDMPRGKDVRFPVEACEELKQAGGYERMILLNGHFHQRSLDGPVLLPGSLARLTHGEEQHEPGFIVVEW